MNISDKENQNYNSNNNSLKPKYILETKPENNEESEGKAKEFNYSYISCLTSRKKPDIYTKEGVLTSKNYKIRNMTNENENSNIKEKERPNEKENVSEEEKEDDFSKAYNDVNKLDLRYFSNNNITIICFNCREIGHMARSCPNPKKIICDRCKEEGHTSFECNNIKCFKCNKMGHRAVDCVIEKNFPKCVACKNNGHYSHDCLFKPKDIDKKMAKQYRCHSCNKKGHFFCNRGKMLVGDYESEGVDISDDTDYDNDEKYRDRLNSNDLILLSIEKKNELEKEKDESTKVSKKKKKQVFTNLGNGLIQFTISVQNVLRDIQLLNVV